MVLAPRPESRVAQGNSRTMGGTVLAGPAFYGSERMVLMGARLPAVTERTKTLLGRLGWAADEPGPGLA
jgi:hypothetical protein